MTNGAPISDWLTKHAVTSREDLIHVAMLANSTERYEEMAAIMRSIAMSDKQLTIAERNMLSVSYKNIVGALRSAWRVITTTEIKEENVQMQNTATLFRQNIEEEMKKICNEVLNLMTEHLIQNATSTESRVYYLKMVGDYYRYLSEVVTTEESKIIVQNSEEAYASATKFARTELSTTDPTRLGLALNHAVFYYEIKNDTSMARQLARIAFDEAEKSMKESTDKFLLTNKSSYKDTTLIMQLLKDNLNLWTSELAASEEGESDDLDVKM